MKKMIQLVLVFALLLNMGEALGLVLPASAAASSEATALEGATASSEAKEAYSMLAEVDITGAVFDITVPTSIPVYVDGYGNVTTGDAFGIVNNSAGPIEVVDLEVTTKNNWELVNYDTDFSDVGMGAKVYALSFNDADVISAGDSTSSVYNGSSFGYADTENWSAINGGETLNIAYDAKVAGQVATSADMASEPPMDIGIVRITLDWYKVNDYTPVITGVYDADTFTSSYVINLEDGDAFSFPTVTATSYDGLRELDVTMSGSIDISTEGTYQLIYEAYDEEYEVTKTVGGF